VKISDQGIAMIKEFEGLRLTTYKCAAGVKTIGYGHTGSDVYFGQRITEREAENLLRADLARFEKHVNSYDSAYGWTQNEFDALVSFAFNVGSIDQLTYNGVRSKKMIADKMLEYCKAGGKRISGLMARRQREREMFLGVDNVDNSVDNSEATLVKDRLDSINHIEGSE
jgi:GH24 family phage-related lysozyme (muramidase)